MDQWAVIRQEMPQRKWVTEEFGTFAWVPRPFGVGHSQSSLLQRLAIERAEIARNWRADPFARAEALLSADIERQRGSHCRAWTRRASTDQTR